MRRVTAAVCLFGLVVALCGAWQASASLWFPVCEQGRYWYNDACGTYCEDMMSDCLKLGGTVACCQHYPSGVWECFCLFE